VFPLVQVLAPRSICVGVQGDSADLVIKTDALASPLKLEELALFRV
jgi:hypothetical protein